MRNLCGGVLCLQAHYRVITGSSSGIVQVLARFLLSSVTADFTQTFSIAFESVSIWHLGVCVC